MDGDKNSVELVPINVTCGGVKPKLVPKTDTLASVSKPLGLLSDTCVGETETIFGGTLKRAHWF